eukprot:6191163-Alexandrium_andersonii.AAC.1
MCIRDSHVADPAQHVAAPVQLGALDRWTGWWLLAALTVAAMTSVKAQRVAEPADPAQRVADPARPAH